MPLRHAHRMGLGHADAMRGHYLRANRYPLNVVREQTETTSYALLQSCRTKCSHTPKCYALLVINLLVCALLMYGQIKISSTETPVFSSDLGRSLEPQSSNQVSRTVTTDLTKRIVAGSFSKRPSFNPFLPAEVLTALERKYHVDQPMWDSGATTGDSVAIYEFPFELNLDQIMDKIKGYSFFAADVEVTVQINTTQFNYGSVYVWGHPAVNSANFTRLVDGATNIYGYTAFPGVVLSAQEATVAVIRVPWVALSQGLAVDTEFSSSRIGVVGINVIDPIFSSADTGATDIPLLVSARFVNVDLWGFEPLSTPAISQSAEAVSKSASGLVSGVKEGIGRVSDLIGKFASLAEFAIPFLPAGSKPPMVSAPVRNISGPTDPYLCQTSGLSTAVRFSNEPDAQISRRPGIVGPESPDMSIYELARTPMLVGLAGFNNTGNAPGDIVHTFPIDLSHCPTFGDGDFQVTFAALAAQQFLYWRGSIKFSLKFFMSSFMKCRVGVAVFRDPPPNILGISGDTQLHVLDLTGDSEFNFRVDWNAQDHMLLCQAPNNTIASLGNICIYLLSPIVSTSTADPPVYCQIWQAAGDDLCFQRFTSLPVTQFPYYHRFATVTPLAESQSAPHEDFKREFPGINPSMYLPERGYITPEIYGSIARLCHRPSDVTRGTTASDETTWVAPNVIPDTATAGVPFAMNDLLLSCFRFWRGETGLIQFAEPSVGSKGVNFPRAQDGNASVAVTSADFFRQCATPFNGGGVQAFTVMVPWYHNAPLVEFDEIWDAPDYSPTVSADSILNGRRGWFAGEDFCVGTLRPPPLYTPPATLRLTETEKLARARLAHEKDDCGICEHFGVSEPPNLVEAPELSKSQRLANLSKLLAESAQVKPQSSAEFAPVSTKPAVPTIGLSSRDTAPRGALARIFGASRK
jgi:hypothetical protein